MNISQTSRAALIAIHTIDSAPQKPTHAAEALMQRLGLACLACTLGIAATGSASAGQLKTKQPFARSGRYLAKAFVQKKANSEHPYSPTMNLRDAAGDFLQGGSQW